MIQMDPVIIKRLSILVSIWLSLFTLIILTHATGAYWFIYAIIIAIAFTIIKQWNISLQEPLLDLNLTNREMYTSVILAVLVALFGGFLMQLETFSSSTLKSYYLAFIMTSSQFTLLKSVQPDPASPTHGFNRVVSLSRPIYFCILSTILISCDLYTNSKFISSDPSRRPSLVFYSFDIFDKNVINIIANTSLHIILLFPIIFVIGLLPQITTFIIYLLEQIDMHLFGATASTLGLKSAAYSFGRSSMTIILLYFLALQANNNQSLLSIFAGLLVSLAYFLSRNSSDSTIVTRLFERFKLALLAAKQAGGVERLELEDLTRTTTTTTTNPKTKIRVDEQEDISNRIQARIDDISIARLQEDLIRTVCIAIAVCALHITTVFHHYHDLIDKIFGILAIVWGLLFHFIIPQLRRDIPCTCLAEPVLRPKEYNFFEVKTHAKVMWFEKVHYYGLAIEKNFIYPIFWLNTMTKDSQPIKEMYGYFVGPLILTIISLKLIRSSFNDASGNYITIIFTYLFFNYDIAKRNYRIFSINYFVFSILHLKIHELLLKLQFVYVYIAPWQIPWGSAFHAFAQPFSVPHSALLFSQAILSSILSAPLQPILGSAIFLMSYVRPVKFWERDYNTNVIDINSTRLVTQLERNRIDSNRLDGVFYEHLTKCLQRKLYRDLSLGRWGPVSQGDCFIMASDNLNCLVHIIEYGNGMCTFQLRGLEFKGTYCQQQEVEAITEGVSQDVGFCCCEPGRLPYFLSANSAFNQLWLAWHVTHTRYVLEGYSISDNPAGPMLQPFDLRRALITYYVKAIIYFTVTSSELSEWLQSPELHEIFEYTKDKRYADLDPTFSLSLDLDFDLTLCGVTRAKFGAVYFDWIKYCFDRVKYDRNDTQRAKAIANYECNHECFLVSICYGLSLVARRSLSAAANGQQFHTVESLLYGLHALLKGDFRVTSLHDEWIFKEIKLFNLVVIPSVRMSLKLHQDHFAAPDDYDDHMTLYEAIAGYQKNLVISHETDVAWRLAILSGVPSLLSLRLYSDDGSNQYKFIMLNRRFLSFRIIKINRECVRSLWASQQQELIFFRNTDPERGSIQNARQALRNMINSSCDLPVGYPIYVSPLTISYEECAAMSGFNMSA